MKWFIVEISGVCNARCPFCCTGAKTHQSSGFMEPSLFEAIIAKISKDYAYLGGIPVYIYNWGEPFLHPNYVELMHILAKYPNIYCMTSTNAGYVPELDEISAKMIRRVRLSMSGFSQESYDHIHKLPFDKVVRNIEYLVETFDKYDAKCDDFYIAFFEYPFTHPGYEDEVHKAREFTERLGLGLSVEKPGINDLRSYLDFYLGRMSEDRREFYNKYLNLDYAAYAKKAKSMRSRLKKSGSLKPPVVKAFDAANNCLTGHRVSINQRGELLPCCFVPYDDPQLVLGNFVELSADQVEKKLQRKVSICRECMEVNTVSLAISGK